MILCHGLRWSSLSFGGISNCTETTFSNMHYVALCVDLPLPKLLILCFCTSSIESKTELIVVSEFVCFGESIFSHAFQIASNFINIC